MNDDAPDQGSTDPGIGLEYDPNRHVLRVDVLLPDGTTQSVFQTREQAMILYRSVGVMLGPDYEG